MAPADAAREVHARVAALPAALRSAAVAWLRPEHELAKAIVSTSVGTRLPATDPARVASKQSPQVAASLRGVPYLLKDLFDVAGIPTKAGSTFVDQVRPTPGDSMVVQRLRDAGAALAGKTHLVEFASGLTGENPHYGDCPHPHFPQRLSGGSSSGSAALVSAGVVPLAIGTDTGGSVRVPAAWCGLYGFRLTPGDELIRDAFPLAPTMDTAGWFTAHAADMLTTWRTITGSDASAIRPPRGCYLPGRTVCPTINPAVDAACEQAAAQFAPRADRVTADALVGSWQNAVDTYVTIGMSEAHGVHRDWLAPFREHYDPVIWQRFTDGGQYSAEKITAARRALQQIRHDWTQYFATSDFLVMPSVPTTAPTKADCTPELRRGILSLTASASLGGLPCLSLPVPVAAGLAAGLQVVLPAAGSAVVPWLLSR